MYICALCGEGYSPIRVCTYNMYLPGMRLVIIAISTCGAINSEGIDFISDLAKRTDNSIPLALLDQASWAAPRLAPMICMALGFAVRRGLAAAVYHWWRRSHAFVQRPPAPPSSIVVLLPPPSPPPPPPPPPRRPQLDDDLSGEVLLLSDSDES